MLIQAEDLIRSPAIYPYARASSEVQARRLREAHYRQASFLDERIADQGEPMGPLDWSTLVEASHHLIRRTNFIFHIGHVGSTLLARLLGESPGVFCLREPALLRPLAQEHGMGVDRRDESGLDVLMRLYSRTWRTNQTALIKATSFVSELAEGLLLHDPQARALVLSVTPPVYLRTILGGSSSRVEIEAVGELRRSRLQRRLGVALQLRSQGEWIAMSWLCEALCLDQTVTRFGERVMWLDFDRFLADPIPQLGAALAHLDPMATPDLAPTLIASDVMGRYAKAPEYAYDGDLRRAVLVQAEAEHGAAVRAGMDWLQSIAAQHPAAVTALSRAAQAAGRVGAAPPAR